MHEQLSNAFKKALLEGRKNAENEERLEEFIKKDNIDSTEKIKVLFECNHDQQEVLAYPTFKAHYYDEDKLSDLESLVTENLSVLELAIYVGNYRVFVKLFDHMSKIFQTEPLRMSLRTRSRLIGCMSSVRHHDNDYFPLLYYRSTPFFFPRSTKEIFANQHRFDHDFIKLKDQIDGASGVIMETRPDVPHDLIPLILEYPYGDHKFCIETLENTLAYHINRAKNLCAERLEDRKKAEWLVNCILASWFYKGIYGEFRRILQSGNIVHLGLPTTHSDNVKCFFLAFNEFLENPDETNRRNLQVGEYSPLFSWQREKSDLLSYMIINVGIVSVALIMSCISMAVLAGVFVLTDPLMICGLLFICSSFIHLLYRVWECREDIALKLSLNSLIGQVEKIKSNKSVLDNNQDCTANVPSHENNTPQNGLLAQFARLFKNTFSCSSAAIQEVGLHEKPTHPSERISSMEATY